MWMDLINGIFETIGAACVLLNVRALLRDRHIAGVHWAPTVFFTTWGAWNVVYYPTLDQWFSTAGGALLLLANIWWIALVWHFSRQPRWVPHWTDNLSVDFTPDRDELTTDFRYHSRTIEPADIPFGPAHPDWPGIKGSQNG